MGNIIIYPFPTDYKYNNIKFRGITGWLVYVPVCQLKLLDGKMKRIIFAAIVLTSVFSLIMSCSKKSDITVRYEMEKMLDETDRLQSQFALKGPKLSDDDFKLLVKAYSSVMDMTSLPRKTSKVESASNERKGAWSIALLANTRIGILYKDRHDYDKAYDYFETVVKCPAASPVQVNAVMNYMAICQETAGRYKKAASLYDSLANNYLELIVPLNPNMDALEAPIKAAEMWSLAGDSVRFNIKLKQARDYYNKLRKKFPGTAFENIVIGKIVATYLRQNRFQEAISLMQATKDDSTGLTPPGLMLMIADIQMKYARQYKDVEKTYREFIRAYPEHDKIGSVHLGLGLALYEQGLYYKARRAIKDIDNIQKVTSHTVAEAYFLKALCYEKEGRWEKAIGQFDLIQATFPGTDKAFEAGLYVAYYYSDKGKTKLAAQAFKEAEEYIKRYTVPETTNPLMASRALGYLVRCYAEMGDLTKAIETLTSIYNNYPNLPEGKFAPLKIADLYENMLNQPRKAAHWLTIFLKINPEDKEYKNIQAHIKELEK